MRLGKTSKENINCVNQIVGLHNSFDNKKELWIIYTTHGHRGADVIKRYNGTTWGVFGSMFSKIYRNRHQQDHDEMQLLIEDFVDTLLLRSNLYILNSYSLHTIEIILFGCIDICLLYFRK